MKVAIVGTRGIPASYGGFETFAEELGFRLAARGHEVTVYCRSHHTPRALRSFRGVRLIVLPTLRHKYFDTVVHALLSSLHAVAQRYDAVLVCNAANAFCLPLFRAFRVPVAINVDGLERKRRKWGLLGRWHYAVSERIAYLFSDEVVSDAQVIQSYYRERYGRATVLIPYGAPTEKARSDAALRRYNLEPHKYFLYVSRFEPENNAHLVLQAFRKVETQMRLVMVGGAPYAKDYIRTLEALADERVLFTGYVFGDGYRELMSHAYCYVHATEVGGTHPALLESMGMADRILVGDTPENREVADGAALFFSLSEPDGLAERMRLVLADPQCSTALTATARERIRSRYTWEAVADTYEALFQELRGTPGPRGPTVTTRG